MFGFFRTNKALRAQVDALMVRNDRANKSVRDMRDLLMAERAENKRLQAESIATLEMMRRRLVDAGAMRPATVVKPAIPGQSRIIMPTRVVARDEPIINHGSSSLDLSSMMLGGLMVDSASRRELADAMAPEPCRPAFSSGGGGDYGGGGATSSWASSSSSDSSSSSSSDSSSNSSDSSSSSSSD